MNDDDDEAMKPVVLDRSGGIGLITVCYKKLFAAGREKPKSFTGKTVTGLSLRVKFEYPQINRYLLMAHS